MWSSLCVLDWFRVDIGWGCHSPWSHPALYHAIAFMHVCCDCMCFSHTCMYTRHMQTHTLMHVHTHTHNCTYAGWRRQVLCWNFNHSLLWSRPVSCPGAYIFTCTPFIGHAVYTLASFLCGCDSFCRQCKRGVLQPTPVIAIDCAVPYCGPYVTPVYDDACGCGRCPPVPSVAGTTRKWLWD